MFCLLVHPNPTWTMNFLTPWIVSLPHSIFIGAQRQHWVKTEARPFPDNSRASVASFCHQHLDLCSYWVKTNSKLTCDWSVSQSAVWSASNNKKAKTSNRGRARRWQKVAVVLTDFKVASSLLWPPHTPNREVLQLDSLYIILSLWNVIRFNVEHLNITLRPTNL